MTGSSAPAGFADLSDEEKESTATRKKTEVKDENNQQTKKDLKYEPADYHHSNSSGLKSKAPTNPEQTLNDSIQIKDTSPRRIGVDSKTGEINIFDSTNNGTYHGHIRNWAELTQEMKNVLIKSGKATPKGIITP